MQLAHGDPQSLRTNLLKHLDHPLVPHLSLVSLPPHVHDQLAGVWGVDRDLGARLGPSLMLGGILLETIVVLALEEDGESYLQGEENRKPADHAFGFIVHGDWIGAELDPGVENGLEIAG